MDWNFNKQSSGYLSEFYQEPVPGIPHTVESISFGSSSWQRKGEFSCDLQLGNVGSSSVSASASGDNNTEPLMMGSGGKWKEAGGAKAESSSSSSWSRSGSGPFKKRARGISNGTQPPFCVVDGCGSDLSNCREYHRRHKVCEVHSKTPVVTINGRKLRFCQQCSRFQSLEEFDEGKRSCRKRLDGHNRRRRKHQPDPIAPRPSSFSSSFHETKWMQLSGTQVFTTMYEETTPSWRAASTGMLLQSSREASEEGFHGGGGRRRRSSHGNMNSGSSTLCARLNRDSDSDCARSLLSTSQQPRTRTIPLVVQSLPSLAHEPIVYGSDVSAVSGNGSASAPRTFPFHWE